MNEYPNDLKSTNPDRVRPFSVMSTTLREFRGFHELIESEWSGVNVLVGLNGSGKSAILTAITICLSRFVSTLLDQNLTVRLALNDITNGAQRATVSLRLKESSGEYQQGVTRHLPGLPPRLSKPRQNTFADLASHYQELIEEDDSLPVPIICLYPVSRAVFDISPAPSPKPTNRPVDAYIGAFKGERRMQAFFEWFRDREDLENERGARGRPASDYQLAAVREAISSLMSGYTNLRIERAPPRMLLDKGEEVLDVNQLSDGEKTLLAMTGDLARRLAIANPESDEPLCGAGIVLIDEVDLHLHPSWQRRVVSSLPKVFPNIQFFMTTHSPIVASSAPPGSLYLLNNRKLEKKIAYGQDVAIVLEEIFGTKPREEITQSRIDQLLRALTLKELTDPSTLIKELKDLEGQLGTDDPLLIRVRTRMRGLGIA